MKRFLLTLLLILPITVMAEEYGMILPQWKDFAPSAFVDVEEPKGIMAKFNVTAKYWYERRVKFESELEDCKALTEYEERFSCLEDLKSKQFRENTDYNARIEAQQNSMSGIPEMNNRMDTMLPINNYINNYTRMMPNELR